MFAKQKVLKLLHSLKFLLKTNKKTSWLISGRRVTQKCLQSSPLLHPWRESSSPWWCGVKRDRLCTVFLWCANSLSFGLHRLVFYNKVLNPMPTRWKHMKGSKERYSLGQSTTCQFASQVELRHLVLDMKATKLNQNETSVLVLHLIVHRLTVV